MDNFTKFVEAAPMANQEATTVAKALVETIVVRYGAPLQILTDRGTNFEGRVFQEMCRLLEVDKVRTSSYRPQCNGMIERFHRTLNSMLGKVVSENQRDWDDHLPYVMAAYRASVHDVTGFSPNYLVFGRESRAPLDIVYGPPEEPDGNGQTYSTYAAELLEKFEKAYRAARQGLRKGAERRKHSYDLRVRPAKFEAGDWVYYFSPRKFVGRSPKFQRNFTGPWMIVRACGPVNYLLQKSPKAKPFVAHVDKLRHCYGRTKGEWTEATEKVTGGSPQKVTGSATASTSRRPHRRGDGTRETDAHDQDLDGVATSTGRPRRNAGRPVRFQ